jgi:hypothetical protein
MKQLSLAIKPVPEKQPLSKEVEKIQQHQTFQANFG